MSQEKKLSIILPDGDPQGIKIVSFAPDMINPRPIRCAFIPKHALGCLGKEKYECLKGMRTPGLYFLLKDKEADVLGEKDEDIYVGESSNCLKRIKIHKKGAWHNALVFYVENMFTPMHKAHAQFLECYAIDALKSLGKKSANIISPTKPRLSNNAIQACEAFFEEAKFLCSFVGYPLFDSAAPRETTTLPQVFRLSDSSKGVSARAKSFYDGKKTRVLRGSKVAKKVADHFDKTAGQKRIKERISWLSSSAIDRGGYFELTKDREFNSPSTAAEFCLGTAANGPESWIRETDGRKLGDIKKSLADKGTASPPKVTDGYKIKTSSAGKKHHKFQFANLDKVKTTKIPPRIKAIFSADWQEGKFYSYKEITDKVVSLQKEGKLKTKQDDPMNRVWDYYVYDRKSVKVNMQRLGFLRIS